MEYLLHILILIGIYLIAAASLNLVAGYTGLLSIAHAAFYGVGAYAVALMGLKFGVSFWMSLPCAMLTAALLGAIVAIPSLRMHDDYFVLATFALQVIVTSVMTNWVGITGGPLGLPGVPQPVLFGVTLSVHWQMLLMVWTIAVLIFWLLRRLVRAPFGRVLRAIREDEVFAQSLGKPVTEFKIKAFVLSAALAAVAGSLYAVYITFIDPTSFTVQESIFMLAIVIIGGAGNLWGTVLGAAVLVTLPEVLRFVGLPSAIAANVRQILYGGLLAIMMLWRPQGLLGEFTFHSTKIATTDK
ncbi:branched-chain amino acid ABC transporter permease [Candidatus Poribacteria bacterium]|nr:branched-chain amino acid ABC transporter permease [Candidatus Poribacteria bacterium]